MAHAATSAPASRPPRRSGPPVHRQECSPYCRHVRPAGRHMAGLRALRKNVTAVSDYTHPHRTETGYKDSSKFRFTEPNDDKIRNIMPCRQTLAPHADGRFRHSHAAPVRRWHRIGNTPAQIQYCYSLAVASLQLSGSNASAML